MRVQNEKHSLSIFMNYFDTKLHRPITEKKDVARRNKKEWEEVRGREYRRKEEVPGFHLPTQQLFKINIKVTTPPPPLNQTIPKEESRRKR